MKIGFPRVKILMSTYNGAKYLQEQLDSLYSQKNVEISVLIRDDGSKDNTITIVKNNQDKRKENDIQLISGKNIGFSESFWELVNAAGDADFYAFCDQDDVWLPEKISKAIEKLIHYSCPALYTGNVVSVDENLEEIKNPGFNVNGVLSFEESIIYSVLPACTFVFNHKLLFEMKKFSGRMVAHDWTTYLIAQSVGVVVYDPVPQMLYRLHGDNTIGINSKWKDLLIKIRRFFVPTFPCARSSVATIVYNTYKDQMSEEKVNILFDFANYKNNRASLKRLLCCPQYNSKIFKILLLMHRV